MGIAILVILTASLLLSTLAVALILRLSTSKKWFDHVNDRKVHIGNIPRLGGIGFTIAFIIVAASSCLLFNSGESGVRYLPCLVALFLIFAFGVFDDFRPLLPQHKLIVQTIAALIVIVPGNYFRSFAYIDIGNIPDVLWYVITLIWIVGITNAVNLIDGIDGLAGSVSLIITLFFGLIFLFYGSVPHLVLYCVALAGVILGFLVFNSPLPRAKIFMGDCGSQFLGFALAVLPLLERQHGSPVAMPIPYAAALLLIPVFDTVAAVWRRLRDGRRIDSPDRSHIHHKLMNLGLGVRGINAVLCCLQLIIGVLVFISISLEGAPSLYVLGTAYIIAAAFFTTVHYAHRAVMSAQKQQEAQSAPLLESI